MTTITQIKGKDVVVLKAHGKEMNAEHDGHTHRFFRWARENSYYGGQYTLDELHRVTGQDRKALGNTLVTLNKKGFAECASLGRGARGAKWTLLIGEPVPLEKQVAGLRFSDPEPKPDAFKEAWPPPVDDPFKAKRGTTKPADKLAGIRKAYDGGAPQQPVREDEPQHMSQLAHEFQIPAPRRGPWEDLCEHAEEFLDEFRDHPGQFAFIKNLEGLPPGMKLALYYEGTD